MKKLKFIAFVLFLTIVGSTFADERYYPNKSYKFDGPVSFQGNDNRPVWVHNGTPDGLATTNEIKSLSDDVYTKEEVDGMFEDLADVAKTGSYTNLSEKPKLDTTNSSELSTNANEEIDGTIKLHKVSKTGKFTDLSHPTTLAGYGITDAVPSTRTINGQSLSTNVTLTPGMLGAVPTNRTINGHALSDNITLKASDIAGVITNETDPVWSQSSDTVLAHLSNTSNPHSVTTSQIGAVPTNTTINSKPLSGNISLDYSDVGAVPTNRTINDKPLTGDITLTASDVGAFSEEEANGKFVAKTNGNYIITQDSENGIGFKITDKGISAGQQPYINITDSNGFELQNPKILNVATFGGVSLGGWPSVNSITGAVTIAVNEEMMSIEKTTTTHPVKGGTITLDVTNAHTKAYVDTALNELRNKHYINKDIYTITTATSGSHNISILSANGDIQAVKQNTGGTYIIQLSPSTTTNDGSVVIYIDHTLGNNSQIIKFDTSQNISSKSPTIVQPWTNSTEKTVWKTYWISPPFDTKWHFNGYDKIVVE